MCAFKEITKLLKKYECRVSEVRQNKHYFIWCETNKGDRFFISSAVSPSDHRWIKNVERDLRKKLFH